MSNKFNEEIERFIRQVKVKERAVLYTDTLQGQQTHRDDLWAVSTEELDQLRKTFGISNE